MSTTPKALKLFSPTRIVITILIGLSVASYLLIKDFDSKHFENVSWSWNSTFWMMMSVLMIAIRDLAYIVRIRILTEGKISCLLYTSPSPRDLSTSRMPSSA